MNLQDFKNCDPDALKLKQKYQLMRIAGGAHAQEILGERVYKRALEMIRERDTLPPGTIEIDDMYPSYNEQEDNR
jgi:hypothetical protein